MRRTDGTGVANPLTGLLFCADCGAKLYNHHCVARQIREGKQPDPDTGLSPYDHFDCSTYNMTVHRAHVMCCCHHITTRAVRAILLDTIRTVSAYAIGNEAEFVEKVRAASELKREESAKELKRKLARERKRSAELDGIIKKIYESYATGKLSEKRFDALIAEYEREQETLEASVADGQAKLDAFNEDTLRTDRFLKLARKYTDFSELTTPMILEFVDKILVHKPDYSGGGRVMTVDVYLKFIGNFEIPAPELTPEEIAEQERIKAKREASRLRHKRYRDRKRREKLEAEGKAVEQAEEDTNGENV